MKTSISLLLFLSCLAFTGCSDFGDKPIEPIPSLTVVGDTVTEGEIGACLVELSFMPRLPVTFICTVLSGTATDGLDFNGLVDTITIDPAGGEEHAHIHITTNQDSDIEPPETFHVVVSNVTNARVESASVDCLILDDDGLPTLSVGDGLATEGQIVSFTATLNKPGITAVIFSYATTDISATSGEDYTAAVGIDTISPGETSTTIAVTTQDDALPEGTELFTLTVSSVDSALVLDSVASGTILDNEPSPISFANDVQPILTSRCIGCHAGPGASSGFRVDSYASVINSGVHAPQVVPGSSAESRLYLIVTPNPPSGFPRMPEGGSLSSGEIQQIKDWIDQGALDN